MQLIINHIVELFHGEIFTSIILRTFSSITHLQKCFFPYRNNCSTGIKTNLNYSLPYQFQIGPLTKSGIGGLATLKLRLPPLSKADNDGDTLAETASVSEETGNESESNPLVSLLLFNVEAGEKTLYSKAANYKSNV